MNEKDMPKTEEEWKAKLTPEQYKVLREKGTEAPGLGKYVHEHAEGMYKCAACGNPLFASGAKFDSGTGWPSFDQALPSAVRYEHDDKYGMAKSSLSERDDRPANLPDSLRDRTEVLCARCGSHLGHVFDDGPANTTGKRFCMNSVCLALEEKKEVGSINYI